jgi:hypothetical protein
MGFSSNCMRNAGFSSRKWPSNTGSHVSNSSRKRAERQDYAVKPGGIPKRSSSALPAMFSRKVRSSMGLESSTIDQSGKVVEPKKRKGPRG